MDKSILASLIVLGIFFVIDFILKSIQHKDKKATPVINLVVPTVFSILIWQYSVALGIITICLGAVSLVINIYRVLNDF